MTQTTTNPRFLGDGNTQGTVLGTGAGQSPLGKDSAGNAEKVALYGGTTPVVQPSGNAQAAIARGSACGMVVTFSSTQSPNSVATVSTVTSALTLVGGTGAPVTIASGDVLYINKPTAQAGLGIGNIAVSSAGVAVVSFVNASATNFITPTAAETYGVVALRGFNKLTAVLTPASVASNTAAEQIFASQFTGLRSGELVQVMKPVNQLGLEIAGCRVVGNNSLGITFMNVTAGPLTPTAAETYTVISLGGIDAVNNEVLYQITGSPSSVATTTTANRSLAVSNVGVTDTVIGVSKPTVQAGLITGGANVSAAGVIGVSFANTTAGFLTPTASEVYSAAIRRVNPVAPLVIYSQTLTPASVAANTTAEQSFTVTGLLATTPVWVNKATPVPGLGIVGCRVTGANNVGITFANPTGTVITPAADTFVIGNFQMPIDAPGNSILQAAALVSQQTSQLANAIRTALVALGGMAGA
jgi:hypothetical protein